MNEELLFVMCVLLHVQVAAPGEGLVEAAARPRQRPVGQQQSVGSGQNSGRDLSHLRETGKGSQRHMTVC